ncbi:YfzA family protein [Oceanobacillus jeddahense]|uniref:YfzA family protein n=1 Tax=Oceanobacillus jeddahense TaxID=1462527 RepID=UPI000595C713|nr:YfzA family protein [Oceanobacillus jeddahense]
MKAWLIQIGFFIILNLILIIIDATPVVTEFELGKFGNEMLRKEIFTKWFNFYETSFFNVVLLFATIHIILFPFYQVIFKVRKDK